uniref:sn-1-specific diacylglycerol lipase ABHD11 n=1 Tax=Hirondellea gigas TaxID=1518452 RepID=A0A2P2IAU0_9CRUS
MLKRLLVWPTSGSCIKTRLTSSSSSSTRNNENLSLSYDKFEGDSRAPLLIFHGLLGNRSNWKSIAKALNKTTNRTIFTVDCRNHGLSPHSPNMTYPLMGEDVVGFLEQHNIPEALLMGHSMGGRAVMATALNKPDVVSQLLVVDISPYGTSESISTLPRFVEMMRRINLPPTLSIVEARKLVDTTLQPVVPSLATRQFLLTNLYKESSGEFGWRANLEAITRTFNPHICVFPVAECGPLYDGPTTFIGGALSDYIRRSEHDAIKSLFPKANFHYIDGAGHWLHADKPKEFIDLVAPIIS